MSDQALVIAAQRGEFAAFEEIVRRYQGRVFRLVYGMTQSVGDAEEVAQETFLSIFRNIATFRADSSLSSWIFRIAANAALMRLRTRRRKPSVPVQDREDLAHLLDQRTLWPVGEWARQPDDKLLSRELGQRIEAAIVALPEKYRIVLLLRDVEGQSNEEVAQTLGVSVATVKSRLHRSRLFVRQALEKYFTGGA